MMNLTEQEKKYLEKYLKKLEKIYMTYIAVGLLLAVSFMGLIIGIKLKNKDGFLMMIFFGVLGLNQLMRSLEHQKLSRILMKLKQSKRITH